MYSTVTQESVSRDVLYINSCVCARACLVAQSCPSLWDLWTVGCWASLSMGFFRQEYWSRLPFPSPGDLTDPGIKFASPVPPALQEDSLLLSHWGSPRRQVEVHILALFIRTIQKPIKSWTIKKAECQRIGAFELWCWRRLL